MNVDEYLASWLELQRSQLQPSTWESYRSNVDRYLRPGLGHLPLDSVTAAQLSAFYARLQQCGGRRGQDRALSLRTVQFCHAVMHKALKDAVRHEILTRNVAVNATLPKLDLRGDDVRELRAWTADELRTFLAHTDGSPLHDLWLLAATTGLRRGELLGLRWEDVDLNGHTLAVRRALSVVKGQARLKQPKTSRCRTLRLDAVTVRMLERRRRDTDRQAATHPDWRNTWNLVFTEPHGGYIHPDRITHGFRVAVRNAPVPRIRLHDLRHSHATLLHLRGVAPGASLGRVCDRWGVGVSRLWGVQGRRVS